MLSYYTSSHMLLVHSFHLSKQSQHILLNSTRRLRFNFNSSSHLSISLFMLIIIIYTCNFLKANKVKSPMVKSPQWRIYYHSS